MVCVELSPTVKPDPPHWVSMGFGSCTKLVCVCVCVCVCVTNSDSYKEELPRLLCKILTALSLH